MSFHRCVTNKIFSNNPSFLTTDVCASICMNVLIPILPCWILVVAWPLSHPIDPSRVTILSVSSRYNSALLGLGRDIATACLFPISPSRVTSLSNDAGMVLQCQDLHESPHSLLALRCRCVPLPHSANPSRVTILSINRR
jgi:hypothetical protein